MLKSLSEKVMIDFSGVLCQTAVSEAEE